MQKLQLNIGKVFEILFQQRVGFRQRARREMFMGTYLNSLDRVALNIELRFENKLEQALDFDEIEPARKQDGVLNEDAKVLAHERDIVSVRILQ